jgi:Fe-S-cluster containining protein
MGLQLPENVKRLAPGEKFRFACHAQVECFTDCCRDLELALTPYDVLRLKKALKMHSRAFLDRFVILEQEEQEPFPRLYLTMVDDGRASCPFVSPAGCTVYADRPGACRTYPLGRAVSRDISGRCTEFYVLLFEPHCRGHHSATAADFTVATWTDDQGLAPYNSANDALLPLLQHEQVRQGRKLTPREKELFLMALYDLDTFRDFLQQTDSSGPNTLTPAEMEHLDADDTGLLYFAVRWLGCEIFGESYGT